MGNTQQGCTTGRQMATGSFREIGGAATGMAASCALLVASRVLSCEGLLLVTGMARARVTSVDFMVVPRVCARSTMRTRHCVVRTHVKDLLSDSQRSSSSCRLDLRAENGVGGD